MSSGEEEQELTLIDHLIELRDRILKSVVAVVALFLALFAFSNDIYTYVATPLLDALPEGSTMIAIDPTSPFFAPFKLTFYVAFLIAAPYILYQLWSFIAPGLYQNEKAVAIPLFISSSCCFTVAWPLPAMFCSDLCSPFLSRWHLKAFQLRPISTAF